MISLNPESNPQSRYSELLFCVCKNTARVVQLSDLTEATELTELPFESSYL